MKRKTRRKPTIFGRPGTPQKFFRGPHTPWTKKHGRSRPGFGGLSPLEPTPSGGFFPRLEGLVGRGQSDALPAAGGDEQQRDEEVLAG